MMDIAHVSTALSGASGSHIAEETAEEDTTRALLRQSRRLDEDRSKRKGGGKEEHNIIRYRNQIFVFVLAVIAILAISVSLGFGLSSEDNNDEIWWSIRPTIEKTTILQLLSPIYEGLNFDLPMDLNGTPQERAIEWLEGIVESIADDPFEIPENKLVQMYALATVYYATNAVPNPYIEDPDPWAKVSFWLSTSSVCLWHGVVCSASEEVIGIELSENKLSGWLPRELSFLKLTSLDLASNYIYMEDDLWDAFLGMPRLKFLDLDDNYLVQKEHGLPSQLASLRELRRLGLSFNLLSGQLEGSGPILSHLSNLIHLDVDFNYLTGTVPDVVGQLSKLTYMYLRGNELEFSLDFIKNASFTDLSTLWLDENSVTGTIPTEIAFLTMLKSFSISRSSLVGTIPTELGSLQRLQRVWLSDNRLTGEIPLSISQLTELEIFEIQNNDIVGIIPQDVCDTIGASTSSFQSVLADCREKVVCTCCEEC